MGLIQHGKWVDKWYDTNETGGEFKRQQSQYRHWITPDGNTALNNQIAYPAESGRYRLYVSYACPWAHRTLIFRALKQLEEHIDVVLMNPLMLENGWEFDGQQDGSLSYLYQLYLEGDPAYEGRVTVPVLWDKKTGTIVNNESADIIRIFNSAFNKVTGNSDDYYPDENRDKIKALNQRIYDTVNNGVYRAGFATSQTAYENAYNALFDSLDWIEAILGNQPYLTGDKLTEADWRLFTTLIRFDTVYHNHFKCNRNKLSEFCHIPQYLKRLYHMPGIAQTVHVDHIKKHYYGSHKTINPTGIIPSGPSNLF